MVETNCIFEKTPPSYVRLKFVYKNKALYTCTCELTVDVHIIGMFTTACSNLYLSL